MAHSPVRQHGFTRVGADGLHQPIERAIAAEMPVGIEVNGLGYAVLFATPADLGDLALGFALSDRLADHADDVLECEVIECEADVLIRVTLAESHAERITERVRHRATDSSCGLCGLENLEQAVRPLPPVAARSDADNAAVFRALAAI